MNYKRHTICRACGSTNLIPVFDLGEQPLANEFVFPGNPPAHRAPLVVLYCETCSLAQLSVTVDPAVLYGNYAYTTPASETNREHMAALAETLVQICQPKSAIEIGCNDGQFLRALLNSGVPYVEGVDPSASHAKQVGGIPVLIGCFEDVVSDCDTTDLVVARHVFCHVDDWKRFVNGLENVSHKDTVIAIEVPSTRSLLNGLLWDTIYHEHTSYLTLHAVKALLEDTSLRLDRVLHYSLHGGSVVLLLRHRDYGTPSSFCIGCHEKWVSLDEWRIFEARSKGHIERLQIRLADLNQEEHGICGYGAPAKAAVMINACGWTQKDISFVTDTTPEKVGRLIPGTDIPVVTDDALMIDKPNYAVLFAWNYEKEILARKKAYTEAGGQFINPHSI